MKLRRSLRKNDEGVAALEAAFALPIFVVMVWLFIQLAEVYRAVAGIQQALRTAQRFRRLGE